MAISLGILTQHFQTNPSVNCEKVKACDFGFDDSFFVMFPEANSPDRNSSGSESGEEAGLLLMLLSLPIIALPRPTMRRT